MKEVRKLDSEYVGFSRTITPAAVGSMRSFVKIEYADGVEISRASDHNVIIKPPTQEIEEDGTLMKPKATFGALKDAQKSWFGWGSKDKKFNLSGETSANGKKVVLKRGDTDIATTMVNEGKFEFRNIPIKSTDKLTVYARTGWWFDTNDEKLSETIEIQKNIYSFSTKYLIDHKLPYGQLK